MQYLGGKFRISKKISGYLESVRKPQQIYFEPFVGAGWVLSNMTGKRYASDYCGELISMYRALQNGWVPPEYVSEELYNSVKNQPHKYPLELVAFIGFGCSFSGKWFGGYARSGDRNYAKNAKNSLLKKLPLIQDVKFKHISYKDTTPNNCLVYCDPPYDNTTKYGAIGNFDNLEFWEIMRKWSKNNDVYVSEYNAPDDFEVVWEEEVKTDMHTKNGKEKRIEKLFKYKLLKEI